MVSGSRTKKVNDILIEDFEWFDDDEEESHIPELPPTPSDSVRTVLPGGAVEHRDAQGQFHRLDGPAIEWANGDKVWYQNGLRHRLDGPAFEGARGIRSWFVNGLLHRLDGPAFEGTNGDRSWYQNDLLHRLDGPAIEWTDGTREWYVNGEWRSQKDDE